MEIPASADPRRNIAIGGSFILFPLGTEDEQLVEVKSREDSLQSKREIVPRLIELGDQPLAYNGFLLASNDERIVVTYFGLPYLFIYNSDVEHLVTIQLRSSFADEIEARNPPLQSVKDRNDGSILDKRVTMFTSAMELAPDNSIYLVQDDIVTILTEGSKEGYYKVDQRFQFTSSVYDLAEFVDINNIALDDAHLYFQNVFVPYVFRYELD